jgi:hypothetical protein
LGNLVAGVQNLDNDSIAGQKSGYRRISFAVYLLGFAKLANCIYLGLTDSIAHPQFENSLNYLALECSLGYVSFVPAGNL